MEIHVGSHGDCFSIKFWRRRCYKFHFLTQIILLKIKDVRFPPTRHHALPDRNWSGNHFGSRSRYHCVKFWYVKIMSSTRSSRHVPSSVAPAVHWTIRNCSRQQLCFRHHTWSEARWCFEPYVVQFWTGTCHAKLETIFEITRSTRWCCWQTHKYPVRGRSFVICEVVERTGGDVGITGCGTQPRGFAAEYLENQIVHDFVFATSIIHRWLRWFVGRVVGRGETQVSWPYHLRTFEASRPGWTATQNPNWLDDFSPIQMYSHKQTHCFEIAFATVWCRCLSHNPIWFGYPAFDKIWLSHRGQTTTENASIDVWLDTTWRWRLVRYHVPDE